MVAGVREWDRRACGEFAVIDDQLLQAIQGARCVQGEGEIWATDQNELKHALDKYSVPFSALVTAKPNSTSAYDTDAKTMLALFGEKVTYIVDTHEHPRGGENSGMLVAKMSTDIAASVQWIYKSMLKRMDCSESAQHAVLQGDAQEASAGCVVSSVSGANGFGFSCDELDDI